MCPFVLQLGLRCRRVRIADRDRGCGIIFVGNSILCPDLTEVDSGHLMRLQAQGGRLDREVGHRLAQIVESDPIWFVVPGEFGAVRGENQSSRLSGPGPIRIRQAAQHSFECGIFVTRGYDESPRLLVETTRRPTCRFKAEVE